jgi:uncharacterized surface protein with fasciclin (FAS1) repeats
LYADISLLSCSLIEKVLMPPAEDGGGALATVEPTPTQTIAEIVSETTDLSTLFNLLKSDGLEGVLNTLSGDGPFTLFAPSDSAFVAFFTELMLSEDSIPAEELSNILSYHAVAGKITSSDLKTGVILALNDDPITVDVGSTSVTLNGDTVIVSVDIMASNGVIHMIDAGTYFL